MSDVPDFWGTPGDEIAAVNPDDLRNVWKMTREILAHNPGQSVALAANIYMKARAAPVRMRRPCGIGHRCWDCCKCCLNPR